MRTSRVALAAALAASIISFAPAAAFAQDDTALGSLANAAGGIEATVELVEGGSALGGSDDVSLLANGEVADLFLDTSASAWYSEEGHLDYVVDNDLIKGYSDGDKAGRFGPDVEITRAQVATILWRIAGEPTPTDPNTFTDVSANDWFYQAVTWAAQEKIVNGRTIDGVPTGIFDPNENVLREELASMIGRYAAYIEGENASEEYVSLDLNKAPGAEDISDWAYGWMGWCYDNGVMRGNGDTGYMNAKATAKRAEMAKMTHVLCETIGAPTLGTTQVQRENTLLTYIKRSAEAGMGAVADLNHDVYLMPASSGIEHSYWIDMTLTYAKADLVAASVVDPTILDDWNNLKDACAYLSAALSVISQEEAVDLPVYVVVRDSGGEQLLTIRNGYVQYSAI